MTRAKLLYTNEKNEEEEAKEINDVEHQEEEEEDEAKTDNNLILNLMLEKKNEEKKNKKISIPSKYICFTLDKDGKKTIPKGMGDNQNWDLTTAEQKCKNVYGDKGIIKQNIDMIYSDYAVIDIDEKNLTYEEVISKYSFLKDCYYTLGNTKGFHFFVRNKNFINKKTYTKRMKNIDGDLVCNKIWCDAYNQVINGKKFLKINEKQFYSIFDKNLIDFNQVDKKPRAKPVNKEVKKTTIPAEENITIKRVKKEKGDMVDDIINYEETDIDEFIEKQYQKFIENKREDKDENLNIDEMKEHLDNIDMKYYENYSDLYKLIYAVNSGNYEEDTILKDYLKEKIKHLEKGDIPFNEWFEELFNKGKYYNYCNKKTIFEYSYISNMKNFFIINSKYNTKTPNICPYNYKDLANMFLEIEKNNIVVKNEDAEIYIYNEKFKCWLLDYGKTTKDAKNLKYKIGIFLEEYYKEKDLTTKDFSEYVKNEIKKRLGHNFNNWFIKHEDILKVVFKKHEKMRHGLIESKQNKLINCVCEKVIIYLFSEYTDNHILFDMKDNLICFKNGICYDLNTYNFRNIERDDYILTKLNYDWIEPSDKEYNEFLEFFDRITNFNLEVKKDILYILSTCLYGRRFKKFFIFEGEGRNGKSLIVQIHERALKAYTYSGPTKLLSKGIDGTKGDPSLSNIDNKRGIFYNEGDDDNLLYQPTVKSLVGDATINGRGLFSNKTEIINIGTHILVCNTKGNMSGETNDACIGEKMIVVNFKNRFTNDDDLLKLPNHYLCDEKYEGAEQQEIFKFSYLKMLFNFIKKQYEDTGKHLPFIKWKYSKIVLKDSASYIKDSDIIYKAILEQYEYSENENDKVRAEKIYVDCVKYNKDIIENKLYPHYKNLSLSGFKKYLEKSEKFKNKYNKEVSYYKGERLRGLIKNYKKIDFDGNGEKPSIYDSD